MRTSPARLRDTDAVARASFIKAAAWGLFAGVVGLLAGLRAAAGLGVSPLLGAVGGMLIGGGAAVAVGVRLAAFAGRAGRSFLDPSGAGRRPRPAYSRAESLAARGMFDAALEAYRDGAATQPDDPRPWISGAQLLELELRRYEEAATWYREARTRAGDGSGLHLAATRALAELYLRRLSGSRRAAPELQRLITGHPGTPVAAWAETELARLRAEILREVRRDA